MAKTKNDKNVPKAVDPPSKEGFPLISDEKLIAIYAAMAKCRMIERRAESLFQHGKLASDFHLSAGREASAAAVVIDLRTEDALCLSPGDRMPAFAKGASVENTFRSLAASEEERKRGRIALEAKEYGRLNILPPDQTPEQIRSMREFAQTAKEEKKGNIVVAFFTANSETLALWEEALTFTGANRLPVIFVHHAEGQEKREFGAADGMVNGIPAIVVDGGDAVALYRVASEAISRARQGRGPTFVECSMPPAATVLDADCIYKPETGNSEAEQLMVDPIVSMEAFLKQKCLWNEETHRQLVTDFGRELDLATRFLND
jgi:pyruvate dehydrogenase E1 component alpha subunit